MPSNVTRGTSLLAASGFWGLPVFFGSGRHQSNLCPHCHTIFSDFSLCLLLLCLLEKHVILNLEPVQVIQCDLLPRYLIAPIEVCFPHTVMSLWVWGLVTDQTLGELPSNSQQTLQMETDTLRGAIRTPVLRRLPSWSTVCCWSTKRQGTHSHQDVKQLHYKAPHWVRLTFQGERVFDNRNGTLIGFLEQAPYCITDQHFPSSRALKYVGAIDTTWPCQVQSYWTVSLIWQ